MTHARSTERLTTPVKSNCQSSSSFALVLLPHGDTLYLSNDLQSRLSSIEGFNLAQPQPNVPLFAMIPSSIPVNSIKHGIKQGLQAWRQIELVRRTKDYIPKSSTQAFNEGVKVIFETDQQQKRSGAAGFNGNSGTMTDKDDSRIKELQIPNKIKLEVVGVGSTVQGQLFIDLEDEIEFENLWICLKESITELVVHHGQDDGSSRRPENQSEELAKSIEEPELPQPQNVPPQESRMWHTKQFRQVEPPEGLPRFELGTASDTSQVNRAISLVEGFKKAVGAESIVCESVGILKVVSVAKDEGGANELVDKVMLDAK
ncbi:hypothetical protein OIO90_001868 [Microbotryomycetes sp. JL221]|nr:hypothetical protein OIO90_001868 [Microbotryomycetes sp. JL221]